MAIPEGCRNNFNTLLRAADNGDLCLAECHDAASGQPVYALCAASRDDEGMIELVPLAKRFDGNPYEELLPPMAEEGCA